MTNDEIKTLRRHLVLLLDEVVADGLQHQENRRCERAIHRIGNFLDVSYPAIRRQAGKPT